LPRTASPSPRPRRPGGPATPSTAAGPRSWSSRPWCYRTATRSPRTPTAAVAEAGLACRPPTPLAPTRPLVVAPAAGALPPGRSRCHAPPLPHLFAGTARRSWPSPRPGPRRRSWRLVLLACRLPSKTPWLDHRYVPVTRGRAGGALPATHAGVRERSSDATERKGLLLRSSPSPYAHEPIGPRLGAPYLARPAEQLPDGGVRPVGRDRSDGLCARGGADD